MNAILIILGVLFGLFVWFAIIVTGCALYLSAQTDHRLQALKRRKEVAS